VEDTVDLSSLLSDYREDAYAHLDALDHALLELERDRPADVGPDRDLLNSVLGSLHTLKGNSGMMGFGTVQKFVHQYEGVLKRLLDVPALLDRQLVNALFESATLLRNAVDQLGANPQPDLSQETAFLEALAIERPVAPAPLSKPAGGKKNRRPASLNTATNADSSSQQRPPSLQESAASAPVSAHIVSNVLRVDFERLDHLLNLTGELVIQKTKLYQVVRNISELIGDHDLFDELTATVQMVEKTTNDLRESIMRVRMLPVQRVFQRFPRMVRDLARQKGKEVELSFSGEDTEIDKTVIDALGEPLLHLIRNSIDHGIEAPGVRVAAGKSAAGNILLSARQESGHIVIAVRDDGGGMNAERIRQKAIERGLISPDRIFSEEDACGLVFVPGFSTMEQVSETSGRGVGLDVVKKVIADFNGIIEVKSVPGFGTEFILKMPLTLAIIPALLVESSGGLYAVPRTAVVESVKIASADIHHVEGREVAQLRGNLLAVRRLSQALGLPLAERKSYYMVILARAEKRIGMLVDKLWGQQEVVIKALDDYLGETPGVSGATILGDGRVVLIVDTSKIIQ